MANTYNRINKTFIVESENTFNITGFTFNGDVLTLTDNGGNSISSVINNFSGLTVNGDLSGTTLYGDGSQLTGINNFYITGGTINGTNLILDRNDILSAITIDLSSFIDDTNTFITGTTFNNNTLSLTDNVGNQFNTLINNFSGLTVNGDISGTTFYGDGSQLIGINNFYITGATINSNNILSLDRNDTLSAVTIDLSQLIDDTNNFTTGTTINNNVVYFDRNDILSAYTLDLTPYVNVDTFISGVTFNNNKLILSDNNGNQFNTLIDNLSGLTVNGNIYANKYYGDGSELSGISTDNFYVTGATIDSNNILSLDRNDSLSAVTVDLSQLIDDTNTFVTGATFNNNKLTLTDNTNTQTNVNIESFTGITVNGDINMANNTKINITNRGYLQKTGSNHYLQLLTTADSVITFPAGTRTLPALSNTQTFTGTNTFSNNIVVPSINFSSSNGVLSKLGNHTLTLTTTGNSNVTFPTTGTLVTTNDLNPLTGVTFNNNLLTLNSKSTSTNVLIDNLSGLTINGDITANTYFGDGSNLSGISTDNFYVTGGTIYNSSLILDRNDLLSAITVDLSSLVSSDTNFANTNLTLTDNRSHILSGYTLNIGSGLSLTNSLLSLIARQIITFSGNDNSLTINHSSGTGLGLSVTKDDNGEALFINKNSGVGNAVTVQGGVLSMTNQKIIDVANPTNPQDTVTLAYYNNNMYGGKRYTLIKPNGTKEFYDTLTQVRSNWADGDVLHQFADETNITYINVSAGIMFAVPSITWNGNGFKTKVNTINVNSGQAFNIASGKTVYFKGVNLSSEGINTTGTLLVAGTLYNCKNTTIRIFIQLARSSSYAVSVSGNMYGGLVIPEGTTEATNLYPNGIGGSGFYYGVDTRGFQLGIATNFIGGTTTYPCATNFRHSFCDFGDIAIGGGRTFDHCTILSTRNNNGTSNFPTFVARNCTIIHTPSANTHTFYNIPNIILINCTFISTGYLCASFGGTAGFNIIQGGYYAFAGQVNFAANNYAGLVQISDCTIEATNPSATTDVLLFTNAGSTNVKINNVTFKNAGGRSDIRVLPANNVEWKNCKFSKGSSHISVSSGTVADAINNNPARLTDPKGFLNNTGNGNWFMYVPMTTAERDLLTSVSAGFVIRNTTTNFLQVYNGSTWKDLLDLT